MKKILTVAAGDPPTLAELLAVRVGTVDVTRGGVYLDGKRCLDGATPLQPGMKIVAHLDERPSFSPAIVFEDNWLLVVDKPAGMASQASRSNSAGALDAWVKARHPEARLAHRLDRDASGLVLIANQERARAPLAAALDKGRIVRRYLARISGELPGEGDLRSRIARDPHDERRRRALPENDPSGEAAHTHYRALSPSLLELTLDTGRTHQIRVHLSSLGHPIVGDRIYGGAPAERLMLHAHVITLPHPRDNRPLTFSSPAPFA